MPHPQQANNIALAAQVRDMNLSYLARLGHEFVNEIVAKSQDVFQLLKSIQLNPLPQDDRKLKLKDHTRAIELQFVRLRKIYERVHEVTGQFDNQIAMDSLIPFLDDEDENGEGDREGSDSDEMETGQAPLNTVDSCLAKGARSLSTITPVVAIDEEMKKNNPKLRMLQDEYEDLIEMNQLKHRQIKDVIDQMRTMIWDCNTMLAMRRP